MYTFIIVDIYCVSINVANSYFIIDNIYWVVSFCFFFVDIYRPSGTVFFVDIYYRTANVVFFVLSLIFIYF